MKSFKQVFNEKHSRLIYDTINKNVHYWPMMDGWNIMDQNKVGELGAVAQVTYRDQLTQVEVTFDGSGKKGTFEYTYFGKNVKGSFDDIEGLPKIIKSIQKRLPGIKENQQKLIPKSVGGWKVENMTDFGVTYVKEPNHQQIASVTFENIQKIMAGDRGHVYVNVADRVDTSNHNAPEVASQPNMIIAMGLDDIPKILKQVDADLKG